MKKTIPDDEKHDDAQMKEDGNAEIHGNDTGKSQTLQTGASINTCVGTIDEWICCEENLPNHPTIAAFGKRRTGKSTTFTK